MTLKSHDLAHIRSVVLAGHAGSGKTTLAEQVLFRAGAIPRLGRVDDGTAHLDYEPEEQRQHRSLSLAVGTFEHGEHEITVVDTPGYPDFVAEMIEGFHAADAAIFVMDASGGIESGLGILLFGLVMLLEAVGQAHGADLEAVVGPALVAREGEDMGASPPPTRW